MQVNAYDMRFTLLPGLGFLNYLRILWLFSDHLKIDNPSASQLHCLHFAVVVIIIMYLESIMNN